MFFCFFLPMDRGSNVTFYLGNIRQCWVKCFKKESNSFQICLSLIFAEYIHLDKFQNIFSKGKVALTHPMTNAGLERGATAVKQIKTKTRSNMKMNFLNCLLIVSINGQSPGNRLQKWLYESLEKQIHQKYTSRIERDIAVQTNVGLSIKLIV